MLLSFGFGFFGCLYPLAKRFTFYPQVVLGFFMNSGVVISNYVITGQVDASTLLFYAAGVSWTMIYDTVYAHQDKSDDQRIGVS